MKKNRDAHQQIVLEGTEEEEILARLSERVEKAISIIHQLRKERDELSTRLVRAEEALSQREQDSSRLNSMESEYERFREERHEIRSRIERILGSLESLESSAS